jgi:hypothetical protein
MTIYVTPQVDVQTAAEAAKRKVKRANGLLREVVGELAALAEGQDTLGVLRVHDDDSRDAAHRLIELGLVQHGAVDVVVIARPTGGKSHHGRREATKENQNGNSST